MLDEQAREDLIERITAIFTNEADATEFNEDPDGYVDEHLPEGTEASDVQDALPEVGERTGFDFTNVASTGGGASAAGHLSHTYTTIYQQNSFIYAEEGSQVTNIQGDGNAVAQQDVDVDIDVDYGEGEDTETDTEELPETEAPETMPEDEGDFEAPALVLEPEDDLPDFEEPVEEAWEPQVDLEFDNTADAGPAEAPVEEAPEAPAPEMDPVDM